MRQMDLGGLEKAVKAAAEAVSGADDILIVSHIDADGISAAAISAIVCERLGKDYDVLFFSKMGEDAIDAVNNSSRSLVWISDLGSGYLSRLRKDGIVITDHHVPDSSWRKGQTSLGDFNRIVHVNPHDHGYDGSSDLSGAGVTYLVAKSIDPANTDLAYLAIVGACGDMQDSGSGLSGINRAILGDAVSEGNLEIKEDVRLYGRETRPLTGFLQYGSDPEIPGLSNEQEACAAFYARLGIPLKEGRRNRCWTDLSEEERAAATDALLSFVREKDRERLVGETYVLTDFPRGTDRHDAKEFATLLNSCGRYDDAPTGMRICMGDEDAVKASKENRSMHKRNISGAIDHIRKNDLLKVRRYIQYFDAGSDIKDTVLGIVAGMLLNGDGAYRGLPIIAFADSEDGVKVSARAERDMAGRGLDLSEVMKTAASLVGGFGGGHNVAAGATIPEDKKEKFLDIVEDLVSAQVI